MAPEGASLDGFIYDPEKSRLGRYSWIVKLLYWGVGIIGSISLVLILFNRKLRSHVKKRTAELEKSREQYRQEALHRREAEEKLVAESAHYQALFEQSPISLREEDFSEVKKRLEELKKSGVSNFRDFFENNPEEVCRIAGLVKVIDANQSTMDLYGAKTKADLPVGLPGLIVDESLPGMREEFIALAEGRTQFVFEIVGKSLTGTVIPAMVNLSISRGYEKTWSQVFLSISDQTELKKAENELGQERRNLEMAVKARTGELQNSLRQLNDANLRLEEASHHRSRFISSMSHELRTPLTAILGYIDLILKQKTSQFGDKQFSYIENIKNAGNHLMKLISDLLDLAKIDADAMELDIEEIPLKDFMRSIKGLMSIEFRKKQLEVKTCIDPSISIASADRRKFEQIMFNLLSNACKYTPEKGLIGIRVTQSGGKELKVEVSDTGTGIDSGEMEKIFSEFHQSDRLRDESLGGTGIGLALTRRLVELHNGRIGVKSVLGRGSTFWFTLPIVPIEESASVETDPVYDDATGAMPEGRRILVVEDSEVLVAMILDMLKLHHHDVAVAHNGLEAIELAPKHHPELILMDMRMPVMGGIEATLKLRAMPEFADTPIIALTASTGSDAETRQMAIGCSEHLAKPIQTDELFAVIERHLGTGEKIAAQT